MPNQQIHINLFDLLAPLAKTFDLMDPAISDHSTNVAYWVFRLAGELGLPEDEVRELVVAGMLHDIGAFSLQDRLALMQFEDGRRMEHAMAGYLLLRNFSPFVRIADMVRFHHLPWRNGAGAHGGVRSLGQPSDSSGRPRERDITAGTKCAGARRRRVR